MSTKQKVLEILLDRQGAYVSGAQLAQKLEVTRAAVWKAVRGLQEEGHQIAASTNRGYSLLAEDDTLSMVGLARFLPKESLRRILFLPTVESTNTLAKQKALEGAEHGTVILANQQTAGRGRLGRSFHSPPENGIYCSLLLRPERLTATDAVLLTTAASVAVSRAIRKGTGKETQIKWVNDLFLDNRKVCGILTEAITNFENGEVECVILGVGLNFKGSVEELPEELRETAGFLYDGERPAISRNEMVAQLIGELSHLEEWIRTREFLEEYRRRSMVLGYEVDVIQGQSSFPATAVEIDDWGGLVVERKDGVRQLLNTGEISIRRRTV